VRGENSQDDRSGRAYRRDVTDHGRLRREEIVDVESGTRYDDFLAFNVVGLVAKADVGKANCALLFRKAESPSQILVHESIKAKAEAEGIRDLRFLEPDALRVGTVQRQFGAVYVCAPSGRAACGWSASASPSTA
jgi:hypothetical protein